MGRARRRPRLRGRVGERDARICASTTTTSRTGSTSACASSRASRRRTRSGRSSTSRASRSSRTRSARCAGSTPSSTPRTSRSTCRRSAATCSSRSPYKFCGPHVGLAYGRHELLESWRPYKARPPRRSRSAAASRSGRRRTSCSPASRRRSRTSSRSAGWRRSPRTSASSVSASSTACPDGATVYGLQTMDGRVPTFLINLEGVDADDAAKRLADEGFGVWAHDNWYSLGLREKLPYPGQRDPRRPHPLQHRGRDRPLQRGARAQL